MALSHDPSDDQVYLIFASASWWFLKTRGTCAASDGAEGHVAFVAAQQHAILHLLSSQQESSLGTLRLTLPKGQSRSY
ncbi:hypothetical protein CSOJ01_15384 [Colletotrichum sojae]|uniref:Uncharacterized protein n=1 Tax=Colletotrichum sojae TaxID=2175907 RepID=A0A8H6MIZ3_9PEZI|nr:hypothetical protein CSOJ01_15384 [Colletotrichum sojae]